MKLRSLFLLPLLALMTHVASASDPVPAQPIDIALDQCQQTADTTPDIAGCFNEAMISWDKELNTQYKALLSGQSDAFTSTMRQSQRDWITYKNNYFLAINEYYKTMDGTIWRIVAAQTKMNVIRDKALDLQRLVKSTNLSGE